MLGSGVKGFGIAGQGGTKKCVCALNQPPLPNKCRMPVPALEEF